MSENMRLKPSSSDEMNLPHLAARSGIGGMLMGLANLVPGISGGTMLLAAGIYPDFIDAVARVTTFRFKLRPIVILGCVVGAAALAILLCAGLVRDLVVGYRWIMYSLFIGLTLGGVPIVWRMLGKATRGMWMGIVGGLLAMIGLFILQLTGFTSQTSGKDEYAMLFFAGAAGASAMILPGVSGGYLLLVLGQYVPILSAVDEFRDALETADLAAAGAVAFTVGLPVGLGVLAGVVGVSNLLRLLLRRYHAPTLGVLLGLLLGAIIGLWPFQQGILPKIGDIVEGQIVTAERLERIEPEDYPTGYFQPNGVQVGFSALLLFVGFGITWAISRLEGNRNIGISNIRRSEGKRHYHSQ